MSDIDLTVVIACYNEEESIEDTVKEAACYLLEHHVEHEILVVDDGSTDSTLSVAKRTAASVPLVRICHYTHNKGKGYAVRTGMLAAGGRRVLFTDADSATPIAELPKFMAALDDGCAIAIASRAVPGAIRVVHQPLHREVGGRALNTIIQMCAVPGTRDTQCGFKLFTCEAARSIFSRCFIDGFSFDVEVLYLARRFGYKVAELPVRWTHRGNSRVRPFRDGIRLLTDIARIRHHRYEP